MLTSPYYLDGATNQVASVSVAGSTLTLKRNAPATEKTITYLKETA